MTSLFLTWKRLHEDAVLPQRGSAYSAGYDLTAVESVELAPGTRALVRSGWAVALPSATYGRIAPRSGMSVKTGLFINAGVIDEDYRGEIKICAQNPTLEPIVIEKGQRIAQLIIERIYTPESVEVPELPETVRGGDGFGSTGGI
jgi:dUTP pyrophosphatase